MSNASEVTQDAVESSTDQPNDLLDLLYEEINTRYDRLKDIQRRLAKLKSEAGEVRASWFLADARRESALKSIDEERETLKAEQKRVTWERNKFLGAAEVVEERHDEKIGEEILRLAASKDPLASLATDDESAPDFETPPERLAVTSLWEARRDEPTDTANPEA